MGALPDDIDRHKNIRLVGLVRTRYAFPMKRAGEWSLRWVGVVFAAGLVACGGGSSRGGVEPVVDPVSQSPFPALGYPAQRQSPACWEEVRASGLFLAPRPGVVRVFEPSPMTHGAALRPSDAQGFAEPESPPDCNPDPAATWKDVCNGECLDKGERTTICDSLPDGLIAGQRSSPAYFFEEQVIEHFALPGGSDVLAALDPVSSGWVPLVCHPDNIESFTVSNDVLYFVASRVDVPHPLYDVFRAEPGGAALIVDSSSIPEVAWFPKLRVAGGSVDLHFLNQHNEEKRYLKSATDRPVLGQPLASSGSIAHYQGYEYVRSSSGIWRLPEDELAGAAEQLPIDGTLIGFYADDAYVESQDGTGLHRVSLSTLESTPLPLKGQAAGVFNGQLVSSLRSARGLLLYALVGVESGEALPLGYTTWNRGTSPRAYATSRSLYAFDFLGSFRVTVGAR